jgi:hypothetical protein
MLGGSSDQGEAVRYSQPCTCRHEVTILDGKQPFFLKPANDILLFGKEIKMISLGKILETNSPSGPEAEEESF